MKTMMLLSLLWSMAAIAQPPRMSDADASFYGINPCQHDPCVVSVIYTISFCAPGISCRPVRVHQFEYKHLRDCIDQANTIEPMGGFGWYECKVNTVSQQLTVLKPKTSASIASPNPSIAPSFDHIPYVLMRCHRNTCERVSSVDSVSELACETSKALLESTESTTYRCVKR